MERNSGISWAVALGASDVTESLLGGGGAKGGADLHLGGGGARGRHRNDLLCTIKSQMGWPMGCGHGVDNYATAWRKILRGRKILNILKRLVEETQGVLTTHGLKGAILALPRVMAAHASLDTPLVKSGLTASKQKASRGDTVVKIFNLPTVACVS